MCRQSKSSHAGAAVLTVAVAAVALAVAPVAAASLGAVMVAGFAVLGASIAAGAVVVRRLTRQVPLGRGAESSPAARALPATRVQAALPRSQPAALTAARSYVITDAAESRVAEERK